MSCHHLPSVHFVPPPPRRHTLSVYRPVCNGGMPLGSGSSSRWPLLGCSSCCQAELPVAADSSLPLHTPAATTTPRRARTLQHGHSSTE